MSQTSNYERLALIKAIVYSTYPKLGISAVPIYHQKYTARGMGCVKIST